MWYVASGCCVCSWCLLPLSLLREARACFICAQPMVVEEDDKTNPTRDVWYGWRGKGVDW